MEYLLFFRGTLINMRERIFIKIQFNKEACIFINVWLYILYFGTGLKLLGYKGWQLYICMYIVYIHTYMDIYTLNCSHYYNSFNYISSS